MSRLWRATLFDVVYQLFVGLICTLLIAILEWGGFFLLLHVAYCGCRFIFCLMDTTTRWIPYRRKVFKQSRFSSVFWTMIQNNSMWLHDILVLTRARRFQPSFRIRHRISYRDSTRLRILESVWIFTGNTVSTRQPSLELHSSASRSICYKQTSCAIQQAG